MPMSFRTEPHLSSQVGQIPDRLDENPSCRPLLLGESLEGFDIPHIKAKWRFVIKVELRPPPKGEFPVAKGFPEIAACIERSRSQRLRPVDDDFLDVAAHRRAEDCRQGSGRYAVVLQAAEDIRAGETVLQDRGMVPGHHLRAVGTQLAEEGKLARMEIGPSHKDKNLLSSLGFGSPQVSSALPFLE